MEKNSGHSEVVFEMAADLRIKKQDEVTAKGSKK